MDTKIKLSQCMIVKNEEKNIRRALSWGKDLMYEQIVVDTGSNDRTIEIAEEMGATIYRFAWNDDFAAAKNFALGKATGNWIAFLDADEYFMNEDAVKIIPFLNELERKGKNIPFIIECTMLHLDMHGKALAMGTQERIFKNMPEIRYRNRIHENLAYIGKTACVKLDERERFAICHTGYANDVVADQGKTQRNIRLLELETADRPEDYDAWAYLGREYFQDMRYEDAKKACENVVLHAAEVTIPAMRNSAFCCLMEIAVKEDTSDSLEQIRQLHNIFQQTHDNCPDLEYWTAVWMFRHNRDDDGIYWMERGLEKLESFTGRDVLEIRKQLTEVYIMLMSACERQNRNDKMVRYAVLALRVNKYLELAALSLITALRKEDSSRINAQNTIHFLGKIYDLALLKDKLFLLKTAKKSKFSTLEDLLLNMLSADEKIWLTDGNRSSWYLSKEKCMEKYPVIKVKNELDRAFCSLVDRIRYRTRPELLEELKIQLSLLKQKNITDYESLLKVFQNTSYWGRLEPEKNCFDNLELRIKCLKEHWQELINLYIKLGDYRSKKTLLAVVSNWLTFDTRLLRRVIDNDLYFFDLELIPELDHGVFVDVGAGEGYACIDFLESYGRNWQKIYCYEPRLSSYARLEENTEDFHDMQKFCKMAGAKEEYKVINELNTSQSVAYISKIDKDVNEKISLLKIDAFGGEVDTITGSKSHIQQDHPKIGVFVHYGFDEIWQISEMITGIDPSYCFGLRCYEGEQFPQKLVLYAI